MRLSTLLLFVVASTSWAPGQDPAAAARSCNTDTIDWILPGHFDAALARGKQQQRLILIKGVSFGIDVAGARCATKGRW